MTCNKIFLVTFLVLWIGVSSTIGATEKNKPGVCPKPAVAVAISNDSCNSSCSNDSGCREKQKCCNTGCGHHCVYAERPGFCPFNDLPASPKVNVKPKCVSDFDCKKNTKCCERESSRDCLPLMKKKPGACPDVCEPKSEHKCTIDNDCPGNLKCCPKCGQTCMEPKKVMYAIPPP
ncbi:uncharacterized protein RB166_001287 [Leptodactylus fuscus]